MDRLVYASLAAMRGAMSRQTVLANNLANANTVGFRRELATARSEWIQGPGLASRATVSDEVTGADMAGGVVSATGRELDVAVDGDALLAVQAKNGDEAYTRRGDLQLSQSGLLTTGDGAPVLGEGGPITLPPADSISIAKDGQIWIVPQGGDPQTPQAVERLKLVSPAGSKTVKALDGLFRVEGGGALPSDPDAKVTPKSIEGSNVNVTEALVQLIEASRAWETQVKMLHEAKSIDESATNLMRLPE